MSDVVEPARRSVADIFKGSAAAFGTSGLRGLVDDLDDATCIAYTTAFLDFLSMPAGGQVWVGHDLRPSSPRIAAAVLAAIAARGCKAVFCGEIPTPALAQAALSRAQPAIMITGSHIPFDRNGIKFYRPDGELMKADEEPILASKATMPDVTAEALPEADTVPADEWTERFISTFPGVLDGWRVGHYQHSAAGRDLVASILSALGAEIVQLGRSDTFVPVDTEAVSAADRAQALEWAQKYGLDALVTTDGDGDRPLLADENGTWFRGDTLGILAGHALGVTCMVTPVSSTSAVEGSGFFKRVIRTKIGSPHVIAAMGTATGRVAGFEANGGFLTASELEGAAGALSPLPTRDALLPVIAVISLARKRDEKLSALRYLLPLRATVSDRLEATPQEASTALLAALRSIPANAGLYHPEGLAAVFRDDTDGHRITYTDGAIVHLRPSGNAPELRVYVEAESDARADGLLAHALSVAKRETGGSGGT